MSALPHAPSSALTVRVGSEQTHFPGVPGYGESATDRLETQPRCSQTTRWSKHSAGGPGKLTVSGFSGLDTTPSDGVSGLQKLDSRD